VSLNIDHITTRKMGIPRYLWVTTLSIRSPELMILLVLFLTFERMRST